MIAEPQISPFEYAVQHLQLVGWPALIAIAWKVRGAFDSFLHNHLEHMQGSMDRLEAGVKELTTEARQNKDAIVQAIIASK